jgi:hypothetical protein
MLEPRASGHPCASSANGVVYGVINLILHRTVARPSTGHISAPYVFLNGTWECKDWSSMHGRNRRARTTDDLNNVGIARRSARPAGG